MAEAHSGPHPDLGGFLLGGLDEQENVAFEAHLAACPTCRAELEELAPLPSLLDAALPAVDLPPSLRDRMLAAAAAAQRDDPAHGAPSSPSGTADVVADLAARRAGRRFRLVGRHRPLVAIGAVAAGLLLVGALAVRSGDSRPTTEIALGSTPGTVRVERTPSGWRIDLDLELPRRDDGRYYEASLDGPDGQVPVGTFNEGDDVTLWSGVPPSVFSDFVIVEQPAAVEVVRARIEP